MVAKIGICRNAYEVAGGTLVLDYCLYTESSVPQGEKVTAKLLSDGVEVGEIACEFGLVLSGKRQRYDMQQVSLLATGGAKKSDVIGKDIYLLCDYEFWQPEEDDRRDPPPNYPDGGELSTGQ